MLCFKSSAFMLLVLMSAAICQEQFQVTPFGKKFGVKVRFFELQKVEVQGDRVYAVSPWDLNIFTTSKVLYRGNPFPKEPMEGSDMKRVPRIASMILRPLGITLVSVSNKIAISKDQGKTWRFHSDGEDYKDALQALQGKQELVALNAEQIENTESMIKTRSRRAKKNVVIESEPFIAHRKDKGIVIQKEGEEVVISQNVAGKRALMMDGQNLIWLTPRGKVEGFDLKAQKARKMGAIEALNGVRAISKCDLTGKVVLLDGKMVHTLASDGKLVTKELRTRKDRDKKAIEKISDAAVEGNKLYGIGKSGSLFSIALESGEASRIKVDGKMVSGVRFYNSKLICWTDKDIYVVERKEGKK